MPSDSLRCARLNYQYAQLNHDIKETRLAELLPGNYDDDIYLKVHTVALMSSGASSPGHRELSVDDLQKDLPTDFTVRETINGRFIFERKKDYKPHEPYETSWEHPKAKFEPVTNDYNLVYTKPEYEALSHVWGLKDDQTIVYVKENTSSSRRAARKRERSLEPSTHTSTCIGDITMLPGAKRVKNQASASVQAVKTPYTDRRDDGRKDNHDTTISELLIQKDLSIALRHLRFQKRSRMLWVDNICINQDDVSERSHLVRHMGQIYRLAKRVIVWLGPEHSNSQLAMSTLEYLGRQVEITNKGSWRVNAPACLEPTWSRTVVPLPYDSETWAAITALLQRNWFKRLWVWQEAKLANNDSIVQCGYMKMELYRFGAAAWCAAAKATSIHVGLRTPLFRAGDAVLRQFDEPFLNTLLHLNSKECSDPRDKIYGALGLAPWQVADSIKPDYEKEVEEVYKDAAIALCQATGRVDFLLACNLADRSVPGPTWAPDWSVVQRRSPRWLLSTTLASGISISTADISYMPKPTLLVQGVECGTISAVGAKAPDVSDSRNSLLSVIKSWAPKCDDSDLYVTKTEYLLDAFIKTVNWNTLRERCPLDNGLLTLAEAREDMQNVLKFSRIRQQHELGTHKSDPLPKAHYREALGKSFFELDNGYMGMTSAGVEETDIVCVILGCPLPMILRPNCSRHFQVVGPAYVHGLMDAESLLGPLDEDIVVQVRTSSGWYGGSSFRNLITNEVVEEDPRLGELPSKWVRMEAVRTPTDPLHFVRFRDLSTGETINGDPRLLPDALRARGSLLKPLKLV